MHLDAFATEASFHLAKISQKTSTRKLTFDHKKKVPLKNLRILVFNLWRFGVRHGINYQSITYSEFYVFWYNLMDCCSFTSHFEFKVSGGRYPKCSQRQLPQTGFSLFGKKSQHRALDNQEDML